MVFFLKNKLVFLKIFLFFILFFISINNINAEENSFDLVIYRTGTSYQGQEFYQNPITDGGVITIGQSGILEWVATDSSAFCTINGVDGYNSSGVYTTSVAQNFSSKVVNISCRRDIDDLDFSVNKSITIKITPKWNNFIIQNTTTNDCEYSHVIGTEKCKYFSEQGNSPILNFNAETNSNGFCYVDRINRSVSPSVTTRLGTFNDSSGIVNVNQQLLTMSNSSVEYFVGCENVTNGTSNGISFTINLGSFISVLLSSDNLIGQIPNASVVLNWETYGNPDFCTASGGWSGNKNPNGGSEIVNISESTNFDLNCYKGINSSSSSTNVQIPTSPTITITASSNNLLYNRNTIISWSAPEATYCNITSNGYLPVLTNLNSGFFNTGPLTQTQTYTATCGNVGGVSVSSINVEIIPPTGNMNVTDCIIPENNSTCFFNINYQINNSYIYGPHLKINNDINYQSYPTSTTVTTFGSYNYPLDIVLFDGVFDNLVTAEVTPVCIGGTSWVGTKCVSDTGYVGICEELDSKANCSSGDLFGSFSINGDNKSPWQWSCLGSNNRSSEDDQLDCVSLGYSQCNDGDDNDGDKFADYPNDPDCISSYDNDEFGEIPSELPECSDGVDNDGDNLIDFDSKDADPDCDSDEDDIELGEETPFGYNQCNDGIDNDRDGFADWPKDLGCSNAWDSSENNRLKYLQN